MKNISLYILFFICVFFTVSATAQQKAYKGKINVTPLQLEQIGDSLYVSIDFDVRDVNVKLRRSISLIPTLEAPNMKIELPVVMVKGRADYLTSQRELALMSKSERNLRTQNPPYAIIKGYKSDQQKQINYRKVIAFESWMKDAKLSVKEDLCGCGNAPRSLAISPLVSRVQLEPVIVPYEVTPYLAYVKPAAEVIKKREMVGEVFLDFVVSKIDIRPDYMNNPRELKKATDMIKNVRSDAAITVKGISVVGYASPEGTLKFNQSLSEGRANALVRYLLPKFDYAKNMYHIEFGGENWGGLLKMVNGSEMKYKEQVLAILNDKTINDATRKTKLKQLSSGEPYRYMLKEYYPSLRKAICKIDYEVKVFDVVEAKEVFKTNPQNLSLNEMYHVANTYEIGSSEFITLFETAVSLFPNDVTANLNAASAALARKDYISAERYLNKIEGKIDVAEYNNALGTMFMLKGEYEKAEKQLSIAANSGLEIAKDNLAELKKKLKNIELLNKKKR